MNLNLWSSSHVDNHTPHTHIPSLSSQSLQYVYEEMVMSGPTGAPPWLLIGMEGLFGTLICTLVVYPLAHATRLEDTSQTQTLSATLHLPPLGPEPSQRKCRDAHCACTQRPPSTRHVLVPVA